MERKGEQNKLGNRKEIEEEKEKKCRDKNSACSDLSAMEA